MNFGVFLKVFVTGLVYIFNYINPSVYSQERDTILCIGLGTIQPKPKDKMATPKKPSLFAQRMLNSKLKIKSGAGDAALPVKVTGPDITRSFGKYRMCVLVVI